jgi:hypothetical protein
VEDINNHKSYLGNKVLFRYSGLVGGGSGSQADDILINGIKVKTARHKPKQTVFNSAWTENGEEWAVQEFVYAIHKKQFINSYHPKTRTLNGKTITIIESNYETSFSDKSKFKLLYKDFEIYGGKEVTDFYSFNGFL